MTNVKTSSKKRHMSIRKGRSRRSAVSRQMKSNPKRARTRRRLRRPTRKTVLSRVQQQAVAAAKNVTHAVGAVTDAVVETAKSVMPKSLRS